MRKWNTCSILRLPSIYLGLFLLSSPVLADAPVAPDNVSCQGWEADTVRFAWRHDDENVTEYRVQKNIDGAGWDVVETVDPDDPNFYADTGIDTSKNNRYRVVAFNDADDTSATSVICNNRRIYETDRFRIFYGLRGTSDDCPMIDGNDVCLDNINDGSVNRYTKLAGDAMEDSLEAFPRVGFGADKGTEPPGDLDKIPVNVVWCDGGGCAGGGGLGLSPFLLETAFDFTTRAGDPIAYVVSLHEVFHFLQRDYPGLKDPAGRWVTEGQARSTQDKFCLGEDRSTCYDFDDIDTGYAGYVPQVNGYMNNTFRAINESSYNAVLFWTYLVEKYGTSPPDSDTVENGLNLMVTFWEEVESDGEIDGISALNKALTTLGHSERFKDIWKDFSVANYAKNLSGSGVDAKYQYDDMAETGGTYDPVMLLLNQALTSADQVVRTGEFVEQWGANYYQVQPDNSVTNLDIKVTQDSLSTLYYTVLGIQGTDITFKQHSEGRDLALNLPNDTYDNVVVIVAALDYLANYRLSINGVDPTLAVKRPTTGNAVAVGDPAAPDKFLVAVELVDGAGLPLTGIELTDFSFSVGGEAVTPSDIITSSTVQGEHWFVVRAPAQSTNGLYDLQVDYAGGQTDLQSNAVNYAPRNDVESIITIDRSGSMDDFNKLKSAQDAAKLFIDSWRTGDRLGVVSFADDLSITSIIPWTSSPTAVLDAIDNIIADGGTALGDALQASWDELIAEGDSANDWAIVLLSDGLQTTGEADFPAVVNAIRDDSSGSKPVIHALAIGPDADQREMQRAASETNGTYQFISLPAASAASMSMMSSVSMSNIESDSVQLDLDQRYRVVASKMDNLQQIFNFVGPLTNDGNSLRDVLTIPVENGAAELILSLSFDGLTNADITLRNAEGYTVPVFKASARHLVWRVANPVGGDWTLELAVPVIGRLFDEILNFFISSAHAQSSEYLPPYLVHVALRSETRMDMYFPLPTEERIVSTTMPILVSLADTGPIVGADVTADIYRPDGGTSSLALYDDGAHGDGAANDGIYGATFYQTQAEGSYIVFVQAAGNSTLSGAFNRDDNAAFYMYGGGDADNDLLPDAWETANGTDPTIADGNADPDNDGSTNSNEYERSTSPFDPDSDNGGESDGTDINPNDPSDDRIQPTWGVAYPGVNVVHVLYVKRPDYVQVDLLRSTSLNGPYTLVDSVYTGNGLYSDESVVANQQYCYLVVAMNIDGARSAPLNPSCATPSNDPFAPYGYIRINNGQPVTITQEVTLNLWASDAVDPEGELPFEDVIFPDDAPSSGVVDMMISNDPMLIGAVWETYQTTKNWTLNTNIGSATVFAKFRDANGNESDMVSSSIMVDSIDVSQCTTEPLRKASDFALFTYSHSVLIKHHVTGKLAIGGNAQLTQTYVQSNPLDKTQLQSDVDVVIVGSDVVYDNGTVNNGNIVYGGSQNISAVQVNGITEQAYPIAFSIEHAQMKLRAQLWSSLPMNGDVLPRKASSNKLILQGVNPLNVFSLSSSDLVGIKTLQVIAPKGSTALINMDGNEFTFDGVAVKTTGVSTNGVLFNFASTHLITMSDSDWDATLLAPNAELVAANNQFRSTVIVKSINDNGSHIEGDRFSSCLPLPDSL